jgi:hypothetical protein
VFKFQEAKPMMFSANFSLIIRAALIIAVAFKICNAQTSDDPNYPRMQQVDPSLQFYYKLVTTDSGEHSISVKFVYQGLGWLGIGISPDGGMVGSEVVIGQPDAAVSNVNPGEFAISSKSTSGVNLMDTQTLIDGSITQDGSTTTLMFTKLFQESSAQWSAACGLNTFIYATGVSNFFPAYHGNRGSFELDLSSECVTTLAASTATPSTSPTSTLAVNTATTMPSTSGITAEPSPSVTSGLVSYVTAAPTVSKPPVSLVSSVTPAPSVSKAPVASQ